MYGASRHFELTEFGNIAGLRRRRRIRTAEEQVRLSEEQGLASDGERPALLEWLIESRDWCTPLHHLELLSYARALAQLHAGASLHVRAHDEAPSPLDMARARPDGPVAQLLLRASQPWSPATHSIYPLEAQRFARTLLWLGVGLAASLPDKDASFVPWMDVWLEFVVPAAIEWESGRGCS